MLKKYLVLLVSNTATIFITFQYTRLLYIYYFYFALQLYVYTYVFVKCNRKRFLFSTHDTDQLIYIHLIPVIHHLSLYNKNLFKTRLIGKKCLHFDTYILIRLLRYKLLRWSETMEKFNKLQLKAYREINH